MHEASMALSLLDVIIRRCEDEGYSSIESVRLRIGRASGILPEALIFTFNVAKADTIARDADILIDAVSLGGFCTACESDFEVDEAYVLQCPRCGSVSFEIRKGSEMDIVEMEVH